MKSCESCSERVEIGKHHVKISQTRSAIGLAFVYLPILTLPFVIISACFTYIHLRLVGGRKVKTLFDFLPDRASHRYTLKTQIATSYTGSVSQSKLFWILNCTLYCPWSVALFEWHTYLVKVVENWWCPFAHQRKNEGHYNVGAIDQSFWHVDPKERVKLHQEDLNNLVWNQYASNEEDWQS
jgi:hypothetical protein